MNMKAVVILILSSTTAWAQAPEWISHTERQVIGGDIVHWGTGSAATSDVALFKARHMAIKTLIEECGGVANKEIIPRKQYVETGLDGYRAYALVSIDFESCQAAKGRDGQKMENPEIAREQKLYDKLVFAELNPEKGNEVDTLREIQRSIHDDMQDNAAAREAQIQRLTNDIASLRADMEHPTQPVKLPATSSMKIACQAQLQMMANNLQMHATAYGGNMAAPELNNEIGAAQQQRALCERMQ
jgi:hypothetical protein